MASPFSLQATDGSGSDSRYYITSGRAADAPRKSRGQWG
jgi:hypothetical protein